MYGMLRKKSQSLKDDVTRFTQELVRTPSPSLAEGDVADLVEAKMGELGYDRVARDEYGNVVGVMVGQKPQSTLLLNCHMDTVAPGDTDAWTASPYSGELVDGRVHGLGAGDCKGGLAAQVYAGYLLRRALLPLEGNLVVAATVGEEYGRSVGVRRLMEKTLPEMGLKPTHAILGEPTGLGLYYGHDGWAEIEVAIEGVNPFQVEDAARAVMGHLELQSPEASAGELALRRPRFEDTKVGRRATIQMDRRLRQTEDISEVITQVKQNAKLAAQGAGSVAVEVAVRQENQRLYTGQSTVVRHVTNAWSTDPFHPIMERSRQTLDAAGCDVKPGKWQLGRLGMGTAGSLLVGEFGLPTIGFGPGEEDHVHIPNESVSVDRVATCMYGAAAIAQSLVGVPVFGWTSEDI